MTTTPPNKLTGEDLITGAEVDSIITQGIRASIKEDLHTTIGGQIMEINGVKFLLDAEGKSDILDKFERMVLALEQAQKIDMSNDEEQEMPVEYEVINCLGCELFIGEGGSNNWPVMRDFEKFSGARIFCQERDSFGWLIGGIEYKGKKAYYG